MVSFLIASATWQFAENVEKHSPRTVTSQKFSSLQNQNNWSMFVVHQKQHAKVASPL